MQIQRSLYTLFFNKSVSFMWKTDVYIYIYIWSIWMVTQRIVSTDKTLIMIAFGLSVSFMQQKDEE